MNEHAEHNLNEYVTAMVAGQLFGLPILRVQDVFVPERLTRVPLAPPEIAGLLNLRGRIVTLIDMRRRLGLTGEAIRLTAAMAIGVESQANPTGFWSTASAKCSSSTTVRANPIRSISIRGWRELSTGIHRLEDQLLRRDRCRSRARDRRPRRMAA